MMEHLSYSSISMFLIACFSEMLDKGSPFESAEKTLKACIAILNDLVKNPARILGTGRRGINGRQSVTIHYTTSNKTAIMKPEQSLSCSAMGDITLYPNEMMKPVDVETLYRMLNHLRDLLEEW